MAFRVLLQFLIRRYEFWLTLLVLVIGISLIRSCIRQEPPKNWQRIEAFGINFPTQYPMHGLDVSKHNGRINWERVAQMEAEGIRMRFVYIKATEGATLSDKRFDQNWREARRVGLPRGAYHFYHPTRDPGKQARNFIKQVKLEPGDLVPALDFEVVNGVADEKLIAGLQEWLDLIEAHYGVRPLIYTNGNLYRRYIKGHFTKYPLWIADYSNAQLKKYDADHLYIWQHSQSGWVKGIKGQVDINTFVRDSSQLADLRL